MRLSVLAVIPLLAPACDRTTSSAPSATAPNIAPAEGTASAAAEMAVTEDAAVAIDSGPPRLESDPLVSLVVAGFGDAIVSVPVGTVRKRPVLVAVHGNFDRPEWHCQVWRGIIGDRGFVLCPRGVAMVAELPWLFDGDPRWDP